jgi:curli production assembly/transport component CsgF
MAPSAEAQDLVYQPTNPAFGGSPANFQFLLQSAQQQNPFDEQADDFGAFRENPLQNFEQRLQRQIFDQLSREIVQQRFGDQVDLTQEGEFDLQNFLVDVNPGPRGIRIRIFNKNTGEESTIQIPRF